MRIRNLVVVAIALALATSASAQSWPQKPVRFIVPFAAGGVTDVIARIVGEKLSAAWGQAVIIDNKPGAGGSIGAAEAARAAPDGYTLFFPSGAVMTANQYVYTKRTYDPEKDFVAITNVVTGPQVVIVGPESPYKTVQQLIRAAKDNPGKLNFGHAGIGSQTHLAGENFAHAAQIEVVAVPYKNDPQAAAEVLAGRLDFAVPNLAAAVTLVNAGKLRALGVTSAAEAPQLPGVPPVAQTLPGFENSGWFGIVAPAGTPPDVVQRVYRDTRKALDDAEVRAKFFAAGLLPVGNSPAEMTEAMVAERARWARVVSERKIQVQ